VERKLRGGLAGLGSGGVERVICLNEGDAWTIDESSRLRRNRAHSAERE